MCTCTYRTEDGDTVAAREHLTVVSVTGNVPPRMMSIHTLQAFHNTSASTTLLPSTLKGIKACFFFQQYIQRGNKTIPTGSPRTLDDGKPLMDWFLSMATPEEKKILLPPAPVTSLQDVSRLGHLDPGVQEAMRKFIVLRLDVLVRARLIQCYFDARLPCPPLLLSCGGGNKVTHTDDSLSGSAIAQHVKYLKAMGQTALAPVLHNLTDWRRKHNLYTFHPEQVVQILEVLQHINGNWTIQSNGTKKELVLQGFRLLPEWEDTVGGKIRTRVWTTGHSLEKDSEWMRQYNAQVRLDKLSARSTQADSAASGRT